MYPNDHSKFIVSRVIVLIIPGRRPLAQEFKKFANASRMGSPERFIWHARLNEVSSP